MHTCMPHVCNAGSLLLFLICAATATASEPATAKETREIIATPLGKKVNGLTAFRLAGGGLMLASVEGSAIEDAHEPNGLIGSVRVTSEQAALTTVLGDRVAAAKREAIFNVMAIKGDRYMIHEGPSWTLTEGVMRRGRYGPFWIQVRDVHFTPGGPLGKEPNTTLPSGLTGLRWESDLLKVLRQVTASCKRDPITACLTYRDSLGREHLTLEQQAWLGEAAGCLCQPALATLNKDFEEAIAAGDLRRCLMASVVSQMVTGATVDDVKAREALVIASTLVESHQMAAPIWTILKASAQRIVAYENTMHSEGHATDDMRRRVETTATISIYPSNGCYLVRVNASLKNVSAKADPAYGAWYLPPPPPLSPPSLHKDAPGGVSEPGCYISPDMVYLVIRGGARPQLLTCRAATEDSRGLTSFYFSQVLPMIIVSRATQGERVQAIAVDVYGSRISMDTTFDMEILFDVPNGIDDCELLVLGAKPYSLSTK